MNIKLTLLFLALLISPLSISMIVRHDVDSELYIAEESDYPAVFPLHIDEKLKECVATLIAPKWAITAAHCTILINQENGSKHQVVIQKNQYEVKSFHLHPQHGEIKAVRNKLGKLIDVKSNIKDMSYDVALIELTESVQNVTPVPLYKEGDEIGQKILMLGWGDFANGEKGTSRNQPINDGQFRLAYNVIEGIKDNYLTFKFDHPNSQQIIELEGVNGPGDSGGPALITKDKEFYLAGVSSSGGYKDQSGEPEAEGKYGWTENYVRISTIIDWIKMMII